MLLFSSPKFCEEQASQFRALEPSGLGASPALPAFALWPLVEFLSPLSLL